MPTFTAALRGDGEGEAYDLGNLVLGAIAVVTGLLTALGIAFAEPVVILISKGFGGDAAKVELAAQLCRIMMPILALVSLGAVWMGMLNARRHFVLPALAPAVFNLVSLAAGVVVWLSGDNLGPGIVVWSVGTLVAGAVQAGMQLVALWRLGYRPRLRLRGMLAHPGVRRIAALMGPAVIGVAAVQVSVFVNTRFAGSLGDGPVAQLGYAFRLFFLPLGIFGVALATVTTTSVSEAAAAGDRAELARRARRPEPRRPDAGRASAVGLLLLAEPVVAFVYRHGRPRARDADAIAMCLRAYLVGLVPYSLVKIFAPGSSPSTGPGYPFGPRRSG